jgi:eukaryotic-like serine/threonine-protein kinase
MFFFGEGDRQYVRRRADELTSRAVEIAPEAGDSWAARASFLLNVGDSVGAARALRSGLAHAPSSALLQDFLGRLLIEANALEEGLIRLGIAVEIDPTLASARVERSRAFALLGDWANAAFELDSFAGEGNVPRDAQRARFMLWRREIGPLAEGEPGSYLRLYAELLPTSVLTDSHRRFMAERAAGASARLKPLFCQRNAEIFCFVGDVDAAFEATHQGVDADLIDFSWIERCPILDPMRSDPRWAPLRGIVEARAARILDALAREPTAKPAA